MTLDIFEHWTRAVFLGTAKSFQLRTEITDKLDSVGKVADSFKQPKVRISIRAVMVTKIKFWLLQRSMSILKSMLRYSLLVTRPCFTMKATPHLVAVEL